MLARLSTALVLAISLSGLPPAYAQRTAAFPYTAYVIEHDTYVRSGPGRTHYPTTQLPAGYAVEVYRHDGDGWCAIRPPAESFSLAPAHQLRVIDNQTAEVVTDGVVTRVGSRLAQQRNAVQVLLSRGEKVHLVEPPVQGDPWLKIAPPAGEFRWIASRRLSRVPPTESAGRTSKGQGWQSRPGSPERGDAPSAMPPSADDSESGGGFQHLEANTDSQVKVAVHNAANSGGLPWQPEPAGDAVRQAANAAPDADGKLEVVAGSPAEAQLGGDVDSSTASSEPASPPRVRFEGLSSSAETDEHVSQLQIRLSQIVVRPPSEWQLAGLRQETAMLLAQQESAESRTVLRDLLDRIAMFESIQARYAASAAPNLAANLLPPATTPMPTLGLPAQAAAAAAATPGAVGLTGDSANVLARVRSDLAPDSTVTPTPGAAQPVAPPATEALYDAVGTLKPVVSKRENAPRFALVDDHGDVVTFVTASPDVNLQAYLGKRIGVRGSRGFMPEYRRAHVTASRVTALEEVLTR